MTLEIIISLIAVVMLLAGAMLGWRSGGASVLRYAVVTLFATLVAMRYWHLAFAFILRPLPTIPPSYLAAAVFIALFVLAGGLAGAVVNLKVVGFQNVFTNIVDNIVGSILGVFIAILVSSVLLMASALVMAGLGQNYDTAKLLLRLDNWPMAIYKTVETKVVGVPSTSPSHTPMPSIQPGAKDVAIVWR